MLLTAHWILHRQIPACKVESISGKEGESNATAEVMLKGSESWQVGGHPGLEVFPGCWVVSPFAGSSHLRRFDKTRG